MGPDLVIETDKSFDEVDRAMRAMEPWRVHVKFSNGVDTSTMETMQPWNAYPLNKLKTIMEFAGEEIFRGARVLDIGFNAGYNCIALMQGYGAQLVGIDNNRLNLEKAQALCAMAGVEPDLHIADAHTFTDEGGFDVLLHLGTLYHLQDPILALKTTAANLKDGGHLFLETASYEGRDPMDSRFIFGMGGDKTNYWALSLPAIELILAEAGFRDISVIRKYDIKIYEGTGLNRTLLHARR